MGVADGDGERIGGIGRVWPGLRQQHPDHVMDLLLLRMTDTDDALLDLVRRVFGKWYSGCRRRQDRHAPRLPELQACARVLAHEGLLDGRLSGMELLDDARKLRMDEEQPFGERQLGIGRHHAVGHVRQRVAGRIDDSPTRMPQAWIEPDDSDRFACHDRPILRHPPTWDNEPCASRSPCVRSKIWAAFA
jgi:hypothetical protein